MSPFEIDTIVADRRRQFVTEAANARLAAIVRCCRSSMVARFASGARSWWKRLSHTNSACCASA
jgi:hypothetical protein